MVRKVWVERRAGSGQEKPYVIKVLSLGLWGALGGTLKRAVTCLLLLPSYTSLQTAELIPVSKSLCLLSHLPATVHPQIYKLLTPHYSGLSSNTTSSDDPTVNRPSGCLSSTSLFYCLIVSVSTCSHLVTSCLPLQMWLPCLPPPTPGILPSTHWCVCNN